MSLARKLLICHSMANHLVARTTPRFFIVSTLAGSALAALAAGCGAPSGPGAQPADPEQAALALPAGPPEAPQTLKELGIKTAEFGPAGTPLFLSGHVQAEVHDGSSAAAAVLRNLTTTYRLSSMDSLQPAATTKEADGRLYAKLQQLHGGVPVLHREVVVQAERGGALEAVVGELVPDLHVDVRAARLDGDTALSRALATLVATGKATIHEAPALTVFVPDADAGGAPTLGYRALVEYMGRDGGALEELIVRASDGEVLARYSQVYDALSRKVYDYQGKCLGASPLPGTLKRSEGDARASDDAINRIYDNVGLTYWYYKHYQGRDSYNDAGAALNSSAHIAFSTGFSCSGNNAAWLGSPYFQMVYGDGDGSVLLDLSLGFDVSSHELTHAVTSSTSNLVYKNESGALNEAMSDILGASAEAWVAAGGTEAGNPPSVVPTTETWQIGESVAGPMLPGGALRFMNNPTKDGQSKDYYPERYTSSGDNGGVHLNSGIANLAFYLLSEGGKHPRNKTTTNVPGIGIEKAQRIFYLANAKLLPSNATFQVARNSTAKAAENLYGRCSREWQNVHMAWDAVGVLGTWSPCVTPPGGF